MRKTSYPSFFAVDWLQRFQAPLAAHGDMARAGQMVAARLVAAPRQRKSREENAQIKAGTPPADWPGKKRRQHAVAARWTKKNQATHDGDKHHVIAIAVPL